MKVRRRDLVPVAALGAAGTYGILHESKPDAIRQSGGQSPVAVLKADSYEVDLADLLLRGIKECGLDVRGKRVLLKPNLVEFDQATCINTDPRVVAAAVEVFQKLGPAQVIIGECPGHRRYTWDMSQDVLYPT